MPVVTQLETTYEYLRDLIARGVVAPGKKLSRRRLAEEVGVSPALVQQALGQLENEGLVERRPQSGTYVRELTLDEYANLCDLRELIEPYAAARAASRITDRQLASLQKSCQRFRRLGERSQQAEDAAKNWRIVGKLVQEEQVFHGTILNAAQNPLLVNVISNLRLLAQVRSNRSETATQRHLKIADEHEGILLALQARDADLAHTRMLEHIRGSRGALTRMSATSETASGETSIEPSH